MYDSLFKVYSQGYVTIATIKFQKIFSSLQKKPYTHWQLLLIPTCPQPLAITNLVSILMDLLITYSITTSYNLWLFASNLFHLACFQPLFMLQHICISISFRFYYQIIFHGIHTLHFIYSRTIRVVSTLELLIILL